MSGFRWTMGDYVGGDYAVHQAYKPYLAIQRPDEHAMGEFLVQPRDLSDITINLGWEPDVVILIGYRPRYLDGGSDSQFGDRSGGMSIGVLGKGETGKVQFTVGSRIRAAFIPSASFWTEDYCYIITGGWWAGATSSSSLILDGAFTSTGFTLSPVENTWDASDYVAYLAMKGEYVTGVLETGETSVGGLPGYPKGAVFLSAKHTATQYSRSEYWDHMQGFASKGGTQACLWGGAQPTSWSWSTERWEDDRAIVLCTPAASSAFYGASYDVGGRVTAWWDDTDTVTITRSGGTATVAHTSHGFSTGQRVLIAGADQSAYNGIKTITVTGVNAYTFGVTGSPATPATGTIKATVGGITLDYPVYSGQQYRVGYVITGHPSDAGVLETNWGTRPDKPPDDYPDGSNFQACSVSPDVILMAATNYNFDWSDTDPYNFPRSPGQFGFGGSGGLGWHVSPFSLAGPDAIGVHTFGNAVAEIGHYANAGTQYMREYILAGQGANSSPPAYHQHSVNVIPNPLWVNTNWRVDADRRADGTGRGHVTA